MKQWVLLGGGELFNAFTELLFWGSFWSWLDIYITMNFSFENKVMKSLIGFW